VNRAYPPALELIVLRALEKRPENRYPTAGELFQELEAYLVASGARTRNHQIAQYLHELFASDAEVSEMGVRRARAFADDDEGGEDDLDFDKPTPGAGKALADALRASNPFAPTAAKEERAVLEPTSLPVPQHRSMPAPPLSLVSEPPNPRRTTGLVAAPIVPAPVPILRRTRTTLWLGLAVASAVLVGLIFALTHA
jgi:hypothetical protein